MTRRTFLGAAVAGAAVTYAAGEQLIDFHQHTHYHDRHDADLLAHQQGLGATLSVLLPAGSQYGLEANCYGNDSVVALARAHPKQFVFFANELPNLPETKAVLEKYLKLGAKGIGEQKFPVECDSPAMQLVAEIARDYKVPVLMHFQHNKYNLGIERFDKMLKKYPTVNFIGHAQTFWGNIDAKVKQDDLYPKGPIAQGGITDRLLSDYPNFWGDLSAGSGLNALTRDEDHARGFLKRHQDRLLYGSDCEDALGHGDKCSGSQQLAVVRRLSPDAAATHKMLYKNAAALLKL